MASLMDWTTRCSNSDHGSVHLPEHPRKTCLPADAKRSASMPEALCGARNIHSVPLAQRDHRLRNPPIGRISHPMSQAARHHPWQGRPGSYAPTGRRHGEHPGHQRGHGGDTQRTGPANDAGQVAMHPTWRRHGEHPGASVSTPDAQGTGVPATNAHRECQALMADGA